MIPVGIDVGAHSTKAVSENRCVSFPSAVAPYREIENAFTARHPIAFSFANGGRKGDVFVGDLGAIHLGGVVTVTNDARTAGKDILPLYLAAINQLYPEAAKIEARVVAGLPARLISPARVDELKESVSGTYHLANRFSGWKQVISLEVAYVMSQPNGTIMDMAADAHGNEIFAVMEKIEHGYIAVIDVGGETTDVTRLLHLAADKSDSLDFGMRNIERELANAIERTYDVRGLNPYDLHEIVARKSVVVKGKLQDVSQLVNGLLEQGADRIHKFALQTTGTNLAEASFVCLTGGGAEHLFPYLSRKITHLQKSPEPKFANARGFYKKALRMMETR